MIKCPKCGFQQPEDIYCASCGIKMDSYAKKHRATGLATNWMVHVCILVIVIISFVLYDKITTRKPRPSVAAQSTPSASPRTTESRGETNSPSEDESSSASRFQKNTTIPTSAASSQLQQDSPSESPAEAPPETPEDAAPATGTRAENRNGGGIQVSFYRITRQGLAELQKVSQAISIAGESSGGIVAQPRIQQFVSSGDMQYISGNRYKDFDDKHPTMVFKGQRHAEAARNMGLYFQITSLRKNERNQLIEVRGWGALKASEPDENYFTGEMTLTPKTAAFITGFLPKKSTYTEDEKQLFDSDRVLKTLNQESFTDGSTDLIMFIEFSKSN